MFFAAGSDAFLTLDPGWENSDPQVQCCGT
jgi:hypothetical protein